MEETHSTRVCPGPRLGPGEPPPPSFPSVRNHVTPSDSGRDRELTQFEVPQTHYQHYQVVGH